jgi:hypothetical protein
VCSGPGEWKFGIRHGARSSCYRRIDRDSNGGQGKACVSTAQSDKGIYIFVMTHHRHRLYQGSLAGPS